MNNFVIIENTRFGIPWNLNKESLWELKKKSGGYSKKSWNFSDLLTGKQFLIEV